MNKPLAKFEIESADQYSPIPRFVIVRTFAGYQYAPEPAAAAEGQGTYERNISVVSARKKILPTLAKIALVFFAGFFGASATAAFIAGHLIKITLFTH